MKTAGVALLLCAASLSAAPALGLFEGQTDVGDARNGTAEYSASSGEYRVTGGGANMWGPADAFHFVWKQFSGDVTLTARVRFEGAGVNAHRKAGWVVRQSLAADSAYADAVVHGDGLTSLQYRESAGGITKEVQGASKAPSFLRLERRGNAFTMYAGDSPDSLRREGSIELPLQDPVYIGLAVCSHDAGVVETAVFSRVSIEAGAPLKPFAMNWRENSGAFADASFLLDAPAGKDGFVRVAGGRLVKPNGERIRIWGINFTAASTAPSKQDAPVAAAHLARFGINCVRFHFLDRTAPAGLIDRNRNDTRALDPERLDRFDFFVAELKKRGIYTNINLNVGRTYKAGDGVRDHELLGFAKALTYFDERLLELQREYARQLLTHFNPYTRSEYRNEPAVMIVELVNENSIVESWFSGRLLGKATRPNPGTWTDIPAGYEKRLTRMYNAWLRRKLPAAELRAMKAEAGAGENVPRLTPEEFDKASKLRFHTEAAFYMDLEETYFRQMRDYLKNELEVKPLLAGTSDHNHGRSGYPLLRSTSLLDIVDGHTYWQHPRYIANPETGRQIGFEIGNTAMVKDPHNSSVVELSRSAVAGKPYTVSEVNHPFPAEFACEGVPILAAYAALQDWDGVFWYTFEHKDPSEWTPRQPSHFEFRPDPVKMAQLAPGALMFLRGDVRPAEKTVNRSYSVEQVRESIRLPRSERPYFSPGFPLALPLRHASRIGGFDGAARPEYPAVDGDPIVSDTGQLAWRRDGFVTVDTERTQALIGFRGANGTGGRHLAARVDNEFSALTLSALDRRPLAQSEAILLTAAARAANTGMKWNAARTSLTSWGEAPTVIEPVTGAITLRNLEGATAVSATPLDGAGRESGAAIEGVRTAEGWEVRIGDTPTVWYAIRVRRAR